MNIQSKYPTTPDEFLRWNEGREGRREFVNGRVVEMMINVTRNHWRLCNRLAHQLRSQLNDDSYDTGGADFGVRTPQGIRFPDVMTVAIDDNGKALATNDPLLVAEVLSKSTMADDFGPKAQDYQSLRSLQHYLVVSQDEARVWLWSRSEQEIWAEPVIFETGQIEVAIDGNLVTLDLPSLYAGIAPVQSVS